MRANDYDPSTLSKVDAAAVIELAAWARQSAPPGGTIQELIRSAATREIMLTASDDVERIGSFGQPNRRGVICPGLAYDSFCVAPSRLRLHFVGNATTHTDTPDLTR
jgi:hypothetical protein